MPRPNPPRKRPRRRPDAVERAAKAEVSLTRQTAQSKDRNAAPDAKTQAKAKAKPGSKAPPPPPRGRRIDEPFVPWARRSYAILVAVMAAIEVLITAVTYFTLSGAKPTLGDDLLFSSYQPLVVLGAALVAAPIAKFIARESRSLRFMESVMAGIVQYFVWFILFVALTWAIGTLGSAAPSGTNGSPSSTATPLSTSPPSPAPTQASSPAATASPSASASTSTLTLTTSAVLGVFVIDVLSFVLTVYLYPPIYRRLRLRPPPPRQPRQPRQPRDAKPKETKADDVTSNAVSEDEAAAGERKPKDPTP